jgi:hypothetical protein
MAKRTLKNQRERDELLIRLDERMDTLVSANADKETRIRSLEKSKWRHSGAIAVMMFVLQTFGLPWTWKIGG